MEHVDEDPPLNNRSAYLITCSHVYRDFIRQAFADLVVNAFKSIYRPGVEMQALAVGLQSRKTQLSHGC